MKTEHRVARKLAMLTALAITGCGANRYDIEIRPTGETFQRQLTCWREQAANEKNKVVAFPEDELRRIAVAYNAAVPRQKTKKHRFASVFSDQMPNDVGGSGTYTHWNTPLGSMSTYIERFRGNDDLAAKIEMRQKATERLADLLIGWLVSELEDEAGFDELHMFLQNGFRRDLKNISLYGWAYEIIADREDTIQPECFVRIGQYLVERSYFAPDELPTWARALREVEREGPAHLLLLIQRFTALKMGIPEDQPIPPCLRFLSDATVLEASISDYLRRTDVFNRLLEEWEREQAVNPEAKKPGPTDVVGPFIMRAFLPNFYLGQSDQLEVKLETTNEPFLTNGKWDEESKQVQWLRRMLAADSDHSEFPTLVYAVWSIPDKQVQKARFGKVVLEGDSLGKYCLWYRGLSTGEAKEWNDFITSLSPSADLVKRIRAFRFAHELAVESEREDGDLAATPRELILRRLRSSEK